MCQLCNLFSMNLLACALLSIKLYFNWNIMFKNFVFMTVLFAVSNTTQAQIDDDIYNWTLKKEASEIRVYTSKVVGSKFLAVSATMVIESSSASIVALLMDLENCSKWSKLCEESYIQERVSNTETFVYSHNNIPFPGVDRDAVTHVFWEHDKLTGVVSMVSRATTGRIPKVKGVIRITEALAKWRFTPQGDGTLLVESFAHVNPASQMPLWLLNRLVVNSPYKTMKSIRSYLAKGIYDDAKLNF